MGALSQICRQFVVSTGGLGTGLQLGLTCSESCGGLSSHSVKSVIAHVVSVRITLQNVKIKFQE